MTIRSILRALLTLRRGVFRGLSEESAPADPLELFARWFEEAKASGLYLPESFTLATATREARPSARLLLLKAFDERGFVFYTNYESQKATEIEQNPRVALVFYWPILQRQVRIRGTATRIPAEESRAYFRTRPRGSQLGAWASRQSAVLASRGELEREFAEQRGRFEGAEVPLPEYWGGYRVHADALEFWQGRANRLHDRLLYTREGEAWRRVRLSP